MIRLSGIILLIFLFGIAAKGQDYSVSDDKIAIAESESFTALKSFSESAGYNQTDFVYQRMDWNVDPAIRHISGNVTTHFKCIAETLDSVQIDLHQNLQVDSVICQQQRIQFLHADDKVTVYFPQTILNGEIDSFSVYYQGIPPSSGFGSFETNTHGISQTPVLWTLSEPYGAMEWWPCKQSLADKIDSIDIIVSTPSGYKTASNGILVSDVVNEGWRTMHWKHRYPIATYLVAIAVTNYASYSDTLKLDDQRVIDILNYVYPENLETAKTQTPVTAEIMALYNELIGEYPFADEKYGHAQFGWGGGMEHQTMSFMGSFSFKLIVHELAHQWFGDYITLGTWQDIWLNEGFATYLSALVYEHLRPEEWPVWKETFVKNITNSPGGSVFVTDTGSVNRIFNYRLSYQKGSYLLHMLRWVLGDKAFYTGIRNYFNDPAIANGFATTSQLKHHLELAGDTTLQEFFNDWYYGEGYPVYSLTYSQPSENELRILLSQSTSHASVDFFEMPVPVRVYNSDRTQTLDLRLSHIQNGQLFSVNPGFKVSSVVLDPDYWLLSKTEQIVTVDELSDNDDFSIYPNPASTELYFSCSENQRVKTISILGLNGKELIHLNQKYLKIDISELPSGVYLFRVKFEDSVVSRKFIVQKD